MNNLPACKRKVILVTDGDRIAKSAVEVAAKNIGARCISASAGNPTLRSGEELVTMIKQAPNDPVIVMLDDRGYNGEGRGERALAFITGHPEMQVLGVLAVASNTENVSGCTVDASITNSGEVIEGAVNKNGEPKNNPQEGDTLEVIDKLNLPLVIGIGDIGKMDGADEAGKGAPLTTRAFRTIIEKSDFTRNLAIPEPDGAL
ncbi:MAG: stage V sporulation protein AE [Desulfotomaculaceae bacterium]|nr:stage V sporulation protein AE [Desulfotomaculaceae bacterium]